MVREVVYARVCVYLGEHCALLVQVMHKFCHLWKTVY